MSPAGEGMDAPRAKYPAARDPDDARRRYVWVEDSGAIRDLTAEECAYLATPFEAFDSGRPYIKARLKARTPDGRLGGFAERSQPRGEKLLRIVVIAGALVVLALIAMTFIGCRPTAPAPDTTASKPSVMCTMQAVPALIVDAVDSATGAPATRGATIVVRSATFADSASAPDDQPIGLAHEKAGTYTVTVTKPGYQPWSKPGIVVGRDECHVLPERVTAKLRRS